jgi:hypothetical protein
MKNLLFTTVLLVAGAFYASSQPVTEYSYKLDNGINVKTDHCWNQVWVQQDYVALKPTDKSPLGVSTRMLGDLTAGSSFKLLSGNKEVKVQGAAPGTYNLKMTFKLSGAPGTLSFIIGNVVIKPNTKTNVSITLYDYQVSIAESASESKGLATFESKVSRYKGNTDQENNEGIPVFFEKGKHDKQLTPDEATKKTSAKIKPGVYDVLISLNISGQVQKLWLENFTLKADKSYTVTTNLNGGIITYAGTNRDVKKMCLYPAGTADKQTGTPAPIKNMEIMNYDKITSNNSCAPGSYDVLLAVNNKYEWRKNFVIVPGAKAQVK